MRAPIVVDSEHLILTGGQKLTWSQLEAIAAEFGVDTVAHNDPEAIHQALVAAGVARQEDRVAVMH